MIMLVYRSVWRPISIACLELTIYT